MIWIPLHRFGLFRPQSRCSTCWSHPHLGNSLPHLRLRQLSFFSSSAIRHDVFHHLPFDSSSPRESSGSRTPATPPVSCLARHYYFTLFTRSFTCRVRTGGPGGFGSRAPLSSHPLRALRVEVVDIMSSAFVSLWVYRFLGVLQALLSSIIAFLLRFTRSWCFLLHMQHHASCVHSESSVHHRPFG